MQVVLEGSLRHFPLAQILTFLGHHKHGGTFDIEAGGNRARLFFESGKVVAAEAAETTDSREAALEIFSWQEGKFTFLDSANIPGNLSRISMDVESLIAEGQKRAAEGNLYADDDMLTVVDNLAAQDKITMSPDEFKLLFKIGAGRAFKELLGAGIKRRDMALKIQALEGAGLVMRAGGTATPRPLPPVESKPAPKPPAAEKPAPAPEPKPAPKAPTAEKPMPAPTPPPPAPEAKKPEPAAAPPPPLAPKSDADYEATVIGELGVSPADLKKTLMGVLTPEGGAPFPIADDETTIGRDASNGISIPDGSISTRHARVLRRAGMFVIEDLQSRNGTFVNGERVSGDAKVLADGDLIRLGKVIMTFNLPKEEESGDATGNRTMFRPA